MSFEIGPIPTNSSHLLADIIEIILFSGYLGKDYASTNDIESFIRRGVKSEDEIDEIDTILDASTKHNKLEQKIDDAWFMLEHRMKVFGVSYPFNINGEIIEFDSAYPKNDSQKLYIFLLLCSRLKSFTDTGIRQRWAASFTTLSKYALKGLVPNYADIKIFDANSIDRKNHYTTNLQHALVKLGEDMRVKTDLESIKQESTSGDLGLDLVAIVKFDDGEHTGNFTIMGQCGAQGEHWPAKTLEAHSERYRPIFQLYLPWPPVMFIPAHYRRADGSWVKNTAASGVLLVDRLRIIKLLRSSHCLSSATHDLSFQQYFREVENLRALIKKTA